MSFITWALRSRPRTASRMIPESPAIRGKCRSSERRRPDVFPWLLGAAGLFGLWALGSSSTTPTSPASPSAPGAPTSPSGTNVTPANIHAAVAYALAHETSPANLTTFAHALSVYGDTSD